MQWSSLDWKVSLRYYRIIQLKKIKGEESDETNQKLQNKMNYITIIRMQLNKVIK